MRNLLFTFVLVSTSLYGQDTFNYNWDHQLELNTYTVNIGSYGGHELNYEFGRRFGRQHGSEIGIRTGVFYIRRAVGRQYSYISTYLYYRYHFKNHSGSLHFNAGIPVFWLQDDSKIVSRTFWSADEEEEFGYYRKRILLINQLEYEYYFKFGLGLNVGVTNYIAQVSNTSNSPAFDEVSYGIHPGLKVGISYRF